MSNRYQVPVPNGQSRPSLRTLELTSSSLQPRPRFPISPPETERNAPAHGGSVEYKVSMVSTPDREKEIEESPFRHLRRASSVQYNQATVNQRPQQSKTSRWLLVVLPPVSCLEGDPTLGQTLAMGPPGRLQNGVLMPLFPTMYAQLTAIAKEFNFPSTAGVCLYLHVSEPGVNISPRISDDAWQMLWNQYFNSEDNGPAVPSGLPICGQIEFDVDIRKAKWYEYWVTGQERSVSLDASIPPSVAQTMSRWYQEHREATQDASESLLNDNATTPTVQLRSKPVPRPLTLSTRGDSFSKSLAKYRLINPRDADATESVGSKRPPSRLSPVLQVDESATVNQKDLDTLVREWRATTPMAPAIPRPGPAGESVPDTYDDLLVTELDMDDYQWSISSAGPRSGWPSSAELELPLRSVGLDRRMLGSVILTPSVATSFGPNDSFATPTFSNASRFPSPDIAARMIEDSPATPSTTTSWGAPLSWPTTPASVTRIPSPDIAARAFISVPNTPTTATSWGALSVWPATPASVYHPRTPDIGLRAFGSAPATPSTVTSWGAPEFWPPSPLEESRPSTPDIAARVHDDEIEEARTYPFVWPFFNRNATPPYQFVWPFLNNEATTALSTVGTRSPYSQPQMRLSLSSSEVSPFTLVWPYFTKSLRTGSLEGLHLSVDYPSMSIYEAVYPNLVIYPPYGLDSAEKSSLQKPLVENIRPAYDYPNLVIYADTVTSTADEEILASDCKNNYGFFNLYPTVYPFVVPYPARYECRLDTEKPPRLPASPRALHQSTNLSPLYPFFDLYPLPYPSLVVYPLATPKSQVKQISASKVASSVHLASSYPHFVLYRSTYPHLEIYPSVTARLQESEQKADRRMKETFVSPMKAELCSTRLLPHYPLFDLYPTSYPVLEIYPECRAAQPTRTLAHTPQLKDLKLPSRYPYLNIYPTVYPYLEIYPTLPSQLQVRVSTLSEEDKPCNTGLSSFYPYLNIYPPSYPLLEIYPPSPLTIIEHPVVPPFRYPDLTIYETVRESQVSTTPRSPGLPIRLIPTYPAFDLYPAAYPCLEIYPHITNQHLAIEPVLLSGAFCHYPTLCIYPVVQQPRTHRKIPSLSVSVRLSESTIRSSVRSPRQRTRSNQWALRSVSPAVPRLRRGSVNGSDSCDTRTSVSHGTRRPVSRPRIKPRKSHSDLIGEVWAQVGLSSFGIQEESRGLALGVSSLRRVASARVDEIPDNDLHGSRTIPTLTPPVPNQPRFYASLRSSEGPSANLKSVGSFADAIAPAMSGLVRDGGIAERISRLDGQTALDSSSIKPTRRVSKLDKTRYPFL